MQQHWRILWALVAGLVLGAAAGAPASPAQAQAGCRFVLGFAALRDLLGPQVVGECLENERHNPVNGNTEQRTTRGLLVWRKADNWTAFTDGYRTWINGPYGVQVRLNTERFPWEREPVQAPPRSTPTPVPAPAASRSTPTSAAPRGTPTAAECAALPPTATGPLAAECFRRWVNENYLDPLRGLLTPTPVPLAPALPQRELSRVTLSRIDSGMYYEHTARVFIRTVACYEYALREEAILEYARGAGGRLFFDGTVCAVRAVYRPNAMLSRVALDLYRDLETGLYVRTQGCLSLALAEEALVYEDRVYFSDREVCDLQP